MKFKFKGDWKFDLELKKIAILHSDRWFSSEKQVDHKSKLNNGLIPFQIFDQRNYDPDPTIAQLNTLEFIIDNQKLILETLLMEFKTDINPWYAEACGEYDWIPELNSINDLGNLIGIHSIQILLDEKEKKSYYRIDVEYLGDQEHGLALVLHNNSIIGHSGIGDMGYECISKDLEFDKNQESKIHLTDQDFGTNMVHRPHPKYGKLKPWQEDSTEDYLRQLLHQKKNDEFIEAIEENHWNLNHRFDSLGNNCVDLAAYVNNVTMIDYLIDKGADFSKSIHQCIDYHIKKDAIRCLVKHGANIDQLGYWEVTPLKNEIFNYVNELSRVDRYKRNNNERLDEAVKKLEDYKDKILFYIDMGANPNSLDKFGNDYRTLLKKRWNEDYLNKNKIFAQIEGFINEK